MVTFGKTRVLLGGDVEQAAWKDICPEFKEDHFHVHAVKVSHHGSETGFITDLWEKRLGKVKPVAVIAPYRRFQLPKTNALAHIVNHAARVFLTCRINGVSHAAPARTNLRSRLYLRSALKARTPAVDGGCGLCTLKFDDQGNCLDIVCVSPAYEHTVK